MILTASLCAAAVATTPATPPPSPATPPATPIPAAPSGAAGLAHPTLWPARRGPHWSAAVTERRIDSLLAGMTLEEKVAQMVQADIGSIAPADLREYPLGSVLAGGDSGVHGNDRATPAQWLLLTREFHAAALRPEAAHEPIPLLFGIDAVHGHNNMPGAVIYPHNIGMGAAHDVQLVREIEAATAEDVAATGMDWTFAPTVAVPQDVRWGRSYEGFSQDPAQVRGDARAAVEGLQGGPGGQHLLQRGHVAATAKHFIGDGGTFHGIDQGDARIDEAELIRTHAPGYLGALDAGVMTIMASYSSWQGQKMHANRSLLTSVLKERWGFEGFVVGDWNAHEQVPGCSRDHCPQAINAGIDMLMSPTDWKATYRNLLDDVHAGAVSRARVDDAVRRILRVKFRLGLFDRTRPYEGRLDLLQSAEHRALARRAVRESLVLLRNTGVLPLKADARVWVTGPGADNLAMQCGGWTVSWQGKDTQLTDFPLAQTIKMAVRQALQRGGGQLVDGEDLVGSNRPDAVILVFGEPPYAETAGDLRLASYDSTVELAMIEKLKAHSIPVVSVFLSGRPLYLQPILQASDAFVAAWLPGTEAAGVADLLISDASGRPRYDFTGRLSFIWPRVAPSDAAASLPAAAGAGVAYPLGYGLSYPAVGSHLRH